MSRPLDPDRPLHPGRPLRRGRLDVLDRVHPGLADSVRSALTSAVPARLRPAAERDRAAGLAAAAQLVAAGAVAGDVLEAVLRARERWPGPAADRLLVAAAGRVRADGAPAPTTAGLLGVPADEADRLAARLAGSAPADRAEPC